MSKVLIIAFREFKQTVMRPIFIIAVFGIPLIIIGIMALMFVLISNTEQPPLVGQVAIVDDSGQAFAAAQTELSPEGAKRDQTEQIEEMTEVAREQMTGESVKPTDIGKMSMGLGVGEVNLTLIHVEAADEAAVDELVARIQPDDLLAVVVIREDVLQTPDPELPPSVSMLWSIRWFRAGRSVNSRSRTPLRSRFGISNQCPTGWRHWSGSLSV